MDNILLKFQASETWNQVQRTQNLNLLTSALSEFKKALFSHILPNTARISRTIYYLLYTANFYFIYIIELTHSKTILEITVEIKPQPAALDFKNLSQYSSHSK